MVHILMPLQIQTVFKAYCLVVVPQLPLLEQLPSPQEWLVQTHTTSEDGLTGGELGMSYLPVALFKVIVPMPVIIPVQRIGLGQPQKEMP